jgi:hypothetical protein
MEQLFRFLTAAMDLLIQWLTVGKDTPGQEATNPQMRHEFPGFGPPKKVITARRTRFVFQQTREQWQATKILVCNLWPSTRTKQPCEEVTRRFLPQTEWKTKTSPVPKGTARLADLEEIRSDTLRQTDKAQKVITIGHQGNTRFKPYDKGDLEWVVGTNPETIYPTAKLGPKQQRTIRSSETIVKHRLSSGDTSAMEEPQCVSGILDSARYGDGTPRAKLYPANEADDKHQVEKTLDKKGGRKTQKKNSPSEDLGEPADEHVDQQG